jgi:hypothetical protein
VRWSYLTPPAAPFRLAVKVEMLALLRDSALVVLGFLFPALFALLEFASAGESFAGVPGQTWICHHFFPT